MENQQPLRPFTEEDMKRAEARKVTDAENTGLTQENMMVCELGMLYGFEAVLAVLNDEIDTNTMNYLLLGGRKLRARENYDNTVATARGVASAMSKDKKALNSATEDYRKEMTI